MFSNSIGELLLVNVSSLVLLPFTSIQLFLRFLLSLKLFLKFFKAIIIAFSHDPPFK